MHDRRWAALFGVGSLLAACSSFGGDDSGLQPGPDSDAGASADGASDAGADSAAPDVSSVDAAPDRAVDTCAGATFCETFETGDLDAAEARWGAREESDGAAVSLAKDSSPPRRFLRAATQGTPGSHARLTHSLGALGSKTTLELRFAVRLVTSADYEVMVFNILSGGDIVADIAVRCTPDGTLRAAWSAGGSYHYGAYTKSVDDGEWHRVVLLADSTSVSLAVDSDPPIGLFGSPIADSPEWRLSAGAFVLNGGVMATVDVDDVRLDLP